MIFGDLTQFVVMQLIHAAVADVGDNCRFAANNGAGDRAAQIASLVRVL